MNISERILKNAVMLGGDNLYFFKQNIKLGDISKKMITLDGVPVQRVPENNYLFVDGNGVTYGVIEHFYQGDTPPSDVGTITTELHSKNAFPFLEVNEQSDTVNFPTYIEIAAEKVKSISNDTFHGVVESAPGWMDLKSKQKLGSVSGSDFNPKFENDGKIYRFSVASKDTQFHEQLELLDNGRVDVEKFIKKDTGYIDVTSSAIEKAREHLKDILKFQIGTFEYERNVSVINNAFNGFYAWLLERAMGDLARKELDIDYYLDSRELDWQRGRNVISSILAGINFGATFWAPLPTKEEFLSVLQDKRLNLSFYVK